MTVEDAGTCRLKPPAVVAGAVDSLPPAEAESMDQRRWPAVLAWELCGQHEWKCLDPGCHEEAQPGQCCWQHHRAAA